MSDCPTLLLTDENWESDVLASDKPVLVDFWAPWCGPCRRFAPIVDELAVAWRGRVRVGKLNVEEHPRMREVYEIKTIPTLLLFEGGEVVERIVGRVPRARLDEMLAAHSGAPPSG